MTEIIPAPETVKTEPHADKRQGKRRYSLIDSCRGLVLISMILYHGAYDWMYLFGGEIPWYEGPLGYLWQQSICWGFILLSGISWRLGANHLKRGLTVFFWGLVISAVTCLVAPQQRIIFGILSFMGFAMVLLIPFKGIMERAPAFWGFFLSAFLFFLTRDINEGWLGFEGLRILPLPECLYNGGWLFFLGFPGADFYSADYFSVFPWIFLYLCGYFLWRLLEKKPGLRRFFSREIPVLSFLGRHSLLLYVLHQPALMGVFTALGL